MSSTDGIVGRRPQMAPRDGGGRNEQMAFPSLTRSSTSPATRRADPSHLAPEDAYLTASSPPRQISPGFDGEPVRRSRRKDGTSRSRSRRRKPFKKLLWVKQSYPDNYTDQATFLEKLQRNPRLQPYEFWPLVANSTVIVQHVCSVIMFLVCFIGIFQERMSPMAVVGWSSFATFLGWLVCDRWAGEGGGGVGGGIGGGVGLARSRSGRIVRDVVGPRRRASYGPPNASVTSISSVSNIMASAASSTTNLAAQDVPLRPSLVLSRPTRPTSAGSGHSAATSPTGSTVRITANGAPRFADEAKPVRSRDDDDDDGDDDDDDQNSNELAGGPLALRLGTIKSAVLIYFTLLGLSPILKSLTRSTSSDSIWAMSFCLLVVNIFFFDYSGGRTGQPSTLPVASLSTNAALMASTVLASRLPSTGQVFSLTLFSIEVFGLFPVFRRHARHRSWRYHVALTALLVAGAGGGVGLVLMGDGAAAGWAWERGLVGMLVGAVVAALAMGGCSWWLIGLQKYKNDIYGPWDPARPIIISRRRHWDDG